MNILSSEMTAENSDDSRDADIGNVKRSYIYGKAWFVALPRKHFGFVR